MPDIPAIGSAVPGFSIVDGRGETVSPASLRGKKAALIFLRYLGCPLCQTHVSRLMQKQEELIARGVRVVVFTDSPGPTVEEFVKNEQVRFQVVSDPGHEVYSAFGVVRASLMQYLAPVGKVTAAFFRHGHGRFEGSEMQLPGAFVVDEQGVVVFAHLGRNIADNADLDVLLEACR